MSGKELVETLQRQVKELKKQLQEKNELIRVLEEQLVQSHHEKEFQVSGLKQSVESVIREKDSEIRRLRALWSPGESLPADVVDASVVADIAIASEQLNAPELGSGKPNARFGISAENRTSSSRNLLAKNKKEKKREAEIAFIRRALKKNVFLKGLDSNQVTELIECISKKDFSSGSDVITEGESGTHLYVLENGKVEVFHSKSSDRIHVANLKPGDIFGELALLYKCRRTASVRAVTEVTVWRLNRLDFQSIVQKSCQSKQTEYIRLLRTVGKLKSLPENSLLRVADCLEESKFQQGDYIIRQGEAGDTFYIIQTGKVKVTQMKEISQNKKTKKKKYNEELVCYLEKGDYFGETALLTEERRTANVIAESEEVTVLMLDREAFSSLVGSIADITHVAKDEVTSGRSLQQLEVVSDECSDEEDEVGAVAVDGPRVVSTRLSRAVASTISSTPLNSLKVVRILGQGGFGCVKLVTVPGLPRFSFALKSIRKAKIVKTGQQQHVVSEKNLLLAVKSPFIGKLYRTYKDELKIYFLMDAYLGGDIYGVLKKVGPFTDAIARFYAACVLEALDYLHLRGIVYRDLKPENLMLDGIGYVKLVDFGFAKRIRYGLKTYTFCGTPEYFPPEILTNTGHDCSADLWSYGVLIFEMLTRNTPFYAKHDMTVYQNILSGVDGVRFPKRVSKHAESLIRGLCQLEPRKRLGNQRGGINEIRKQRWFQGFDWNGLREIRVLPPFDPDVKDPTDTRNFDETIVEDSFDKKDDKKVLNEANMLWENSF